MKTLMIILSTIISANDVISQIAIMPDSLEKKISAHFEQYTPELFSTSDLAIYGEIPTSFDQDQITKELQLFNEVKNSDLINVPTNIVFALCHNILIHSSEKGKEFLKLLNKPTENKEIIDRLFNEMVFTGKFGELMALDNLESNNIEWSKTWAAFISSNVIYESSIPRIEKMLQQTNDTEIKQELIGALMYISNPKSIETIKHIIETSNNDEVQAKAIFVYAEFAGYDGITYLKSIKAVGEKSKEEQNSGIDWLTKGTSLKNKFGIEVTNNYGFIEDYRNIKSPAIIWLNKEGLLDDKEAQMPTPLSKEKKEILLDLLIKSRGFGLEAAKAQLFLSIEYSDIDKLLMLRQVICYSPNDFAESRLNTIGIFIRYLRKTKK